MRVAREAGVNCFDHAEAYGNPNGEAERIFGLALKELQAEDAELWRRSELVITTKIFGAVPGVNESGLSIKHCREGMDNCLERLQLDYVDMVFCHRPDPFTPTATVVRAMTDIVVPVEQQLGVRANGQRNKLLKHIGLPKSEGLEPPQFEQPQYNMLHRQRFEEEYFPLYNSPYSIGTTIWSPLRSRFLTGKYLEGIPEDSRPTQEGYDWMFRIWRKEGLVASSK